MFQTYETHDAGRATQGAWDAEILRPDPGDAEIMSTATHAQNIWLAAARREARRKAGKQVIYLVVILLAMWGAFLAMAE